MSPRLPRALFKALEWILYPDSPNDLPIIQVLGPELLTACAFGGHHDERIPERQAVDKAAIDGILYDLRRDDNRFESPEGVQNVFYG